MLKSNQSPVLSTTHVKYRYPLTIYDRPFGMLWISDLGRAKWTVSIEIATEEKINCTGTQTGYFLDLATKRPVPLPTECERNTKDSHLNRGSFFHGPPDNGKTH